MKRLIDLILSFCGLLIVLPILTPVVILIWLTDFHNPFYMARRCQGRNKQFKMIKLRSMVVNADKLGGTSTSGNDKRITAVGKFIRKYKLDELTQLWNVFVGQMSFVGPRPQSPIDASLYTPEEKRLLDIKPGITDFASIVFADEADILAGSEDPDLKYNQIIRPWKSRLGLIYVEKNNILIDIKIIYLTVLSIISRSSALHGVHKILVDLGVDKTVELIATRRGTLIPYPPPGSDKIVSNINQEHGFKV